MSKQETQIGHQKTQIGNQQQMLAEFRDLRSILRVQQDVPPQVLLSKPIVFLDARGRYFGFHIEWVNSHEVNALLFECSSHDCIAESHS